jgi:hypothetical protein
MTTTDTQATPAPTAYRKLTQAELGEEAARRFGPNPLDWAFQCPRCGDIATPRDFPEGKREAVGQDCIGRHRGALKGERTDDGRGQADRGCDWCSYGLIRGPWEIVMPDGRSAWGFPLAPAAHAPCEACGKLPGDREGLCGSCCDRAVTLELSCDWLPDDDEPAPSQPPHDAPQAPDGPDGHADTDRPAGATVGPAPEPPSPEPEPVVHLPALDTNGNPTGYALCDNGEREVTPGTLAYGGPLFGKADPNCPTCLEIDESGA